MKCDIGKCNRSAHVVVVVVAIPVLLYFMHPWSLF